MANGTFPPMSPFLYVSDVARYQEFLERAFGFTTHLYEEDPDDPEHVHGESKLGDALVMISRAASKWKTNSPRQLGGVTAGVYAMVDDVDAHCRRARAAGAVIEWEPEDRPWGHRLYTARDPEGHQWHFATARVR
jgi:uncharacterized glyoxalase superfamily protein PhnB